MDQVSKKIHNGGAKENSSILFYNGNFVNTSSATPHISSVALGPYHYIILNNRILKLNSSIFPWSEGYITQYTP